MPFLGDIKAWWHRYSSRCRGAKVLKEGRELMWKAPSSATPSDNSISIRDPDRIAAQRCLTKGSRKLYTPKIKPDGWISSDAVLVKSIKQLKPLLTQAEF
jgi:hypothetical protein